MRKTKRHKKKLRVVVMNKDTLKTKIQKAAVKMLVDKMTQKTLTKLIKNFL